MQWAIIGIATAAAALTLASLVWRRPHAEPATVRQPPPLMQPDDPEIDWVSGPVHRSPLLIRYQEPDGTLTEAVIRPKAIRGERVGKDRVRPRVVNATCDATRTAETYRLERIVSVADARSGEFIEDPYTYLGGAQPGGAPAPVYDGPAAPARVRQWKRH